MPQLERRLAEALGSDRLVRRMHVTAEGFLAKRGGDAAARRLEGGALLGVARVLATSAQAARLLATRPALLESIADCSTETASEALAQRTAKLLEGELALLAPDLETFLDELRILRRSETVFVACLHLGGLVSFSQASYFLSALAENVVRRALFQAQVRTPKAESLSVVGMGKIGGREFTYHSDLDLIFLQRGGIEAIALASRIGQRLVAYLSTMTAAGVAYEVDTRLRPSGGQGMLVTSFDSFAAYQEREAQVWEHLALMRARPVAGDLPGARDVLARTRARVLSRAGGPWEEVANMRKRVERERAEKDERAGRIAFKTGPGGLMDVDFLASGALLERGGAPPEVPSNPALLRSVVAGPPLERLLDAYRELRRIEAVSRWVTGRAIEVFDPKSEAFALSAELADSRDGAHGLAACIEASRATIRNAFQEVLSRGSIVALAG
jgi:[glutamine synthetase] adenylyltransferase / [glutamine synthetase]-adenylyl-L-tyrosine phosphorylase